MHVSISCVFLQELHAMSDGSFCVSKTKLRGTKQTYFLKNLKLFYLFNHFDIFLTNFWFVLLDYHISKLKTWDFFDKVQNMKVENLIGLLLNVYWTTQQRYYGWHRVQNKGLTKQMEKVETIFIYNSKVKSKATDVFGMFEFIDLSIWHKPRREFRQKKVGLSRSSNKQRYFRQHITIRFKL